MATSIKDLKWQLEHTLKDMRNRRNLAWEDAADMREAGYTEAHTIWVRNALQYESQISGVE